jgi:hypothetical protein
LDDYVQPGEQQSLSAPVIRNQLGYLRSGQSGGLRRRAQYRRWFWKDHNTLRHSYTVALGETGEACAALGLAPVGGAEAQQR